MKVAGDELLTPQADSNAQHNSSGQLDGSTLIVEFKDRLMRYAIELVELICSAHNITIVYVEQQDKTDEEMLTADLLSIVFIFGVRQYAKRANEQRKCKLSPECITRAKELMDSGLSCRAATIRLNTEGFTVTEHGVRKYVARAMNKLEKVLPKIGVNSAQEFYAEYAQPGEPLERLKHSDLKEHYQQWCKRKGKIIVSPAKLYYVFNQGYESNTKGAGRTYKALRIKGTNLHFTVKRYEKKQREESPLDVFLRFYSERLNGQTLTIQTVMQRYRRYLKLANLTECLSEESVMTTLKAMGVTVTKKNRALSLSCN